MDHSGHDPGTGVVCADCATLALEPGWYRALRDDHVMVQIPDHLLILDGENAQIHLPDLDAITPTETEA